MAVREICRDDSHAFDGRGNHALLRVLERGNVAYDRGFVDRQAVANQNADAVIGLLAGEPAFVADGREFGDGEFVVGELEFLQTQYVDPARCQPVDHMLLADLE